MVIVQINYCYQNITRAEREPRYTDALAAKFLNIPGLKWKIWLDQAPDEPRIGGASICSRTAPPPMPMWRARSSPGAAQQPPRCSTSRCRVFDVRERMSEITRAPLGQPRRRSRIMPTARINADRAAQGPHQLR